MARYYLDLHNGTGLTRDDEGQEFADLDAARLAAIDSIRSLLSNEVRNGELDMDGHIEIRCDGREPLRVAFGEAVEMKRR
jgi:hypothetical protein